LRRSFCPIGDGIKLFTVYNRFRFVYQNYNYKQRFGPIARYYINWPQEIDIPSEPSESTIFFTIGFSLRRALTKPKRTSIEPQFIDRKAKNFYIFNDLAKLKELETIEVIDSVDMKRDSQKSKCFLIRLFDKLFRFKRRNKHSTHHTFKHSTHHTFKHSIT
jgi:hypothetical protein